NWCATEQDKVHLFTTEFNVPTWDLPQRFYIGRNDSGCRHCTTRFFIHKLPISVTVDGVVRLVFLLVESTEDSFLQFLREHLRLLSHLHRWRIVVLAPRRIHALRECQVGLRRLIPAWSSSSLKNNDNELQSLFELWKRVQSNGSLAEVPVGDLNRVRDI